MILASLATTNRTIHWFTDQTRCTIHQHFHLCIPCGKRKATSECQWLGNDPTFYDYPIS
jgi:hypothetical protein